MKRTLLRHVAVDHGQGGYVYQGGYGMAAPTPEIVADWHRAEHRPYSTTHLDHAHDEVTARRFGLPLTIVNDDPQ